jgi:hypothetical protein
LARDSDELLESSCVSLNSIKPRPVTGFLADPDGFLQVEADEFGGRCLHRASRVSRALAGLGWLIDPSKKVVQVYEAGKDAWVFTGTELAGTGAMAGFTLKLLKCGAAAKV